PPEVAHRGADLVRTVGPQEAALKLGQVEGGQGGDRAADQGVRQDRGQAGLVPPGRDRVYPGPVLDQLHLNRPLEGDFGPGDLGRLLLDLLQLLDDLGPGLPVDGPAGRPARDRVPGDRDLTGPAAIGPAVDGPFAITPSPSHVTLLAVHVAGLLASAPN